ncbi:unnamed protein product [Moneuplotes crassus]|uniref:Uncharacterized protein n=1 Tax=Euplotes crassus TaxID=5936 RepID=A0AAD1X8J4_EUPCR|nr:unnamed protein product [Moneuplotes crassus]
MDRRDFRNLNEDVEGCCGAGWDNLNRFTTNLRSFCEGGGVKGLRSFVWCFFGLMRCKLHLLSRI